MGALLQGRTVNRMRERLQRELSVAREKIDGSGYRKYLTLAVLLGLPAFYFNDYWPAFLLMVVTVLVSFTSARTGMASLGVETATFSTVLSGVVFGPETGALLGFSYITLQMFTGRPPGLYLLWVIPAFALAGYLSGVQTGLGVVRLGIYVSVGLQAFFVVMAALLMRGSAPKYFRYAAFNAGFNYLLFTAAGPGAMALMT